MSINPAIAAIISVSKYVTCMCKCEFSILGNFHCYVHKYYKIFGKSITVTTYDSQVYKVSLKRNTKSVNTLMWYVRWLPVTSG